MPKNFKSYINRINDKYIKISALIVLFFILVYENYPYETFLDLEFLNPIGNILIQLSYGYIGSCIFYFLLKIKDQNKDRKKFEKILKPILNDCVQIYVEFIEGFKNYKEQNIIWYKFEERHLAKLGEEINAKDKYKHCCINYKPSEEEEKHSENYLKYTIYVLSKILNELEDIRIGLDILDDETIEDIWELIRQIKTTSKFLNAPTLGLQFSNMDRVMRNLFTFHKLIVKLYNDINNIYDT